MSKKNVSNQVEFDWFDQPKNRKLLWILLYAVCGVSVVIDVVLYLMHKKHPHFEPYDNLPGFYAVLGFLACAVSILVAKFVGFGLKKPCDYYDNDDSQPKQGTRKS